MTIELIKKKILSTISKIFLNNALEKYLTSLTIGKFYGPMVTKIIPANTLYRKPSIRKVSRDGMHYILDISDIVDWHVYFGIKEHAKEKLYSLANAGDTILDIGTNVGDVAMHLAQKASISGQVIGFEPDPINFKRVSQNLALNSFSNIQILNIGLGESEGTFYVKTPDEHNAGMTRITQDISGHKVTIKRLDYVETIQNLSKINLIKMDIEGYEMNALKGGIETLKKHKPILFIELDNNNLIDQNSSAIELVAFIEQLGYKIHHAVTNQPIASSDNLDKCHFDIVCHPINEAKI